MLYGTVRSYIQPRGFGFIRQDGSSGDEHFFHIKNVVNGEILQAGDRVEFEIGTGKDGRPCAINVRHIMRGGDGPVRFGQNGWAA